jgi:hypothetical protein
MFQYAPGVTAANCVCDASTVCLFQILVNSNETHLKLQTGEGRLGHCIDLIVVGAIGKGSAFLDKVDGPCEPNRVRF